MIDNTNISDIIANLIKIDTYSKEESEELKEYILKLPNHIVEYGDKDIQYANEGHEKYNSSKAKIEIEKSVVKITLIEEVLAEMITGAQYGWGAGKIQPVIKENIYIGTIQKSFDKEKRTYNSSDDYDDIYEGIDDGLN